MKTVLTLFLTLGTLCSIANADQSQPYYDRLNALTARMGELNGYTNTIEHNTNDSIYEISNIRNMVANDANINENEAIEINHQLNLAESNTSGTLRVVNHVIPACKSYIDSAYGKLIDAYLAIHNENWTAATNYMNEAETFLNGTQAWHNEYNQVDKPYIVDHLNLATALYLEYSGN